MLMYVCTHYIHIYIHMYTHIYTRMDAIFIAWVNGNRYGINKTVSNL